jgi:hypothetical protein
MARDPHVADGDSAKPTGVVRWAIAAVIAAGLALTADALTWRLIFVGLAIVALSLCLLDATAWRRKPS